MPDADMAIGVDDTLVSENAVGDHKIAISLFQSVGHSASLNAIRKF
jgi:hypothetical protein